MQSVSAGLHDLEHIINLYEHILIVLRSQYYIQVGGYFHIRVTASES
jgi:hypothetical protein